MRGKREKLFECSYEVGSYQGRLVVPAWSPVEAASLAEEILERSGVVPTGTITVRDRNGRVVLEVAAPRRPGTDASNAA